MPVGPIFGGCGCESWSLIRQRTPAPTRLHFRGESSPNTHSLQCARAAPQPKRRVTHSSTRSFRRRCNRQESLHCRNNIKNKFRSQSTYEMSVALGCATARHRARTNKKGKCGAAQRAAPAATAGPTVASTGRVNAGGRVALAAGESAPPGRRTPWGPPSLMRRPAAPRGQRRPADDSRPHNAPARGRRTAAHRAAGGNGRTGWPCAGHQSPCARRRHRALPGARRDRPARSRTSIGRTRRACGCSRPCGRRAVAAAQQADAGLNGKTGRPRRPAVAPGSDRRSRAPARRARRARWAPNPRRPIVAGRHTAGRHTAIRVGTATACEGVEPSRYRHRSNRSQTRPPAVSDATRLLAHWKYRCHHIQFREVNSMLSFLPPP